MEYTLDLSSGEKVTVDLSQWTHVVVCLPIVALVFKDTVHQIPFMRYRTTPMKVGLRDYLKDYPDVTERWFYPERMGYRNELLINNGLEVEHSPLVNREDIFSEPTEWGRVEATQKMSRRFNNIEVKMYSLDAQRHLNGYRAFI